MEGIVGGFGLPNRNDPFDFGNVKDDDDQMNLNSVEEGRMVRLSSTALQKQAEIIAEYSAGGLQFAEQVSALSGKEAGLVSNFGNPASVTSIERAAHTAGQSRLHHFQAQADKGYTSMAAR